MGVDLAPDEVAFRCNLVTVDAAGTMVDFAAGHITSEQSHPIVAALDGELGGGRDGVRFHPGVEYRHLCVAPADWADAECVPPHDLTGQPAVLADRTGRGEAQALDGRVAARRAPTPPRAVDSVATQIWLWGQGVAPVMPQLRRPLRRRGPVELGRRPRPRASACSPASTSSTSPARPPGSTTTTPASSTRASASLADRDFFLLHVEATDEAGHQNAVAEKVAAARAVGRRDHRPARRRARRRGLPGAPPARPRHAVRVDDPHVRPGAVPPVRLHRRRAGRRLHRVRRGRPAGGRRPRPHGPSRRLASPDPSPDGWGGAAGRQLHCTGFRRIRAAFLGPASPDVSRHTLGRVSPIPDGIRVSPISVPTLAASPSPFGRVSGAPSGAMHEHH